jgi:phosphoglycerol transferase
MKNFLNTKPCRIHYALSLSLVVLLSACGEKPGEKPGQTPATTVAKVSAVDQLAPRYESTLAEGIDFKKPGYPEFLIEVVGVSNRDDWGRWTDATLGPTVKFRFNKPLPNKFVLELQANAFGPNEGKPIKILVGGIERQVTIRNVPSYSVYAAEFDGVVGTDTIEIVPPYPVLPREVDPANKDERKLGLGLATLRIKVTP